MKDVAEVEDIDWRSVRRYCFVGVPVLMTMQLFTFTTSAIRFDGTRTDVRFHFLVGRINSHTELPADGLCSAQGRLQDVEAYSPHFGRILSRAE